MKEVLTIIGTIAAIVAAIVSIFSLRDSKRCIYKRIARKEAKLERLEFQLAQRYGVNGRGRGRAITPLDEKIEKLQREIEYLNRLL